jgi:hypothetical protein
MKLIALFIEDDFDWSLISNAEEIQNELILHLESKSDGIIKGCYQATPVFVGKKRDPWCVEIYVVNYLHIYQATFGQTISNLVSLGYGRNWVKKLMTYGPQNDLQLNIIKVRAVTKGGCA